VNAEITTQTDQARARWAAEYREARKVRHFEVALLDGGYSSLGRAASHHPYIAAIESSAIGLFARRNGRYGRGGRTKRFMAGPFRRLPA
jgi:hypothetical protein